MTTRPFVPPPRVPPPEAGGGKIAVEPPIAAPVPPPRSIWGIVLPIGLIVGVLGFIIAMYVSGQRSLATGFAIFPLIMLMSMGGMLFRGRGAAQKMPWSQLEQYRREYFARLDEVRDEVQEAARKQWQHREHSHWAPSELVSVAGSPRMWERRPGDPEFGVVRLGTGRVELAMTVDKPQIAAASKIEPATGPRAAQVPAGTASRPRYGPGAVAGAQPGHLDGRRHGFGARRRPFDDLPTRRVPQPGRSADHGRDVGAGQLGLAEVASALPASRGARRLR